MIKDYIKEIFREALAKIGVNDSEIVIEHPKNPEHGDFAYTGALGLGKLLKQPPRAIAESIISKIEFDENLVEKIEIAGPGFINIKITNHFFLEVLESIISQNIDYGKTSNLSGKTVNVEYVSVNPTGLLHLGHGRNAAIGDTIANLYEWQGATVTREYYFNNAGNQMNNLAKSIYARYMQAYINPEFTFPEDGYHGDYIKTIAEDAYNKYGAALKDGTEEDLIKFRKFGEIWNFTKIKATLKRMSIFQSVYYNEDSLYSEGKIDSLIDELNKKNLIYEKDGAKWLKFSELGLEDDRVIVKSTGEPTYRLPDIAYHLEKFKRGYDEIVDVFGSDHIATIPDVLAAIKALGNDTSKVKVLIHQFVTLMENGQFVKMSKRTGKSYTLDDLLDEVGADVVRFFLIMRSISTHLEFDLDLARQQSDKNPVFYLQYAHARCCGIIQKAQLVMPNHHQEFENKITKKEEIELIKSMIRFPEAIILASMKHEPHVLVDYLRELASQLHIFYHNCRIINDAEEVNRFRLDLVKSVKIIIKNGLAILGISAPEKM